MRRGQRSIRRRNRAIALTSGITLIVVTAGSLLISRTAIGQTNSFASLPAAKARLAQRQQTALENARTHPLSKHHMLPPPAQVAMPVQAPMVGIVAAHQAPFSAQWFAVSNSWTGVVNGQYFTVYSGARQHPNSGATPEAGVVVYQDPANVNGTAQPTQVGVYLAGTGAAPLAATGATGAVMTLTYGSGATITFNVLTHAFGQPIG